MEFLPKIQMLLGIVMLLAGTAAGWALHETLPAPPIMCAPAPVAAREAIRPPVGGGASEQSGERSWQNWQRLTDF